MSKDKKKYLTGIEDSIKKEIWKSACKQALMTPDISIDIIIDEVFASFLEKADCGYKSIKKQLKKKRKPKIDKDDDLER